MTARLVGAALLGAGGPGRRAKIAGVSSGAFPADLDHIRGLLTEVRPDVVLAFGTVARDAMLRIGYAGELIIGPHPTARGAATVPELRRMARELARVVKAAAVTEAR